MPRKRIIDPEFWSDEEIGQWSHEARLFYIGLWNFADDEGRFKAHPQLLKSQIFPYDIKFDIEKIKKELNNKVQWYEVEGLQYGYLPNFLKHQRIDRPSESKLPNPPPFVNNSPNIPRTLAPNISKVKLREVNISKEKYMEFVFLTKDEHQKLTDKFGVTETTKYIERLNNYIGSTGKKYKSHYHTILNWSSKDSDKPVSLSKPVPQLPVKFKRPDPVQQEAVSKLIRETKDRIGVA